MIHQSKKNIPERHTSSSPDELKKFTVAGKTPSQINFPHRIDQISFVMKRSQKERKKLIILGNNSQHEFGSEIETPDWVLSLSRFNNIISHDVADFTVTVEAGATLSQVQQQLKASNQFLPLDPSAGSDRTLGGIIASNSAGPWRLQYGTCRDLVLGMQVVLTDGTIIKTGGKTVKNVAGYNLSQLFIGSMGTLGAIAHITFKLSPLPVDSRSLLFAFDDLNHISRFVKSALMAKIVVTRCEYLNRTFVRDNMRNKINEAAHYVLLSITGHKTTVAEASKKIVRMATEMNATHYLSASKQGEKAWWTQISRATKETSYSISAQVSLPQSELWTILKHIDRYSIEHHLPLSSQAQAGNGILHLRFGTSDEQLDDLKSHIDFIRNRAKQLQGNMTVQRAPLELRKPEIVWGEINDNFMLMKTIKSKYDPNTTLVSGRFLGGL